MIAEITHIVLPVFLVIALGFSLKKTSLVRSDFIYDLNRLIYFIALPSLLFYKIASADFFVNFNSRLLIILSLSIVLVFFLAYGYGSLRRYPPEVLGAFVQGASRGNLVYVGLAIIFSAYGEYGFTTAGILIGFLVPLINVLSVMGLILPHRKNAAVLGRMFWLKQVLYNPIIVSSLAGIFWSYLQLPLPEVVDRSLGILTGMSLPLALLSIGASFSFSKMKGDLVITLISTAIKIVILPLIAGVLLYWSGVRGEELGLGVMLAGTPTATAAYIMAQQLRGDAELTGAIIMFSTLCSMGTYTIILVILKNLAG